MYADSQNMPSIVLPRSRQSFKSIGEGRSEMGEFSISLHRTFQCTLTAHICQKLKSRFLTCSCYEIWRIEAVGRSIFNYTSKFTIFVKMWNFGQFCENLICLNYYLKFESKNPVAYVWHLQFWLSPAHHISFLIYRF